MDPNITKKIQRYTHKMHGLKICIVMIQNDLKVTKETFLSYIQCPTQCKVLISLFIARNVIFKEVLGLSL